MNLRVHSQRVCNRGFTLVELLVVIAVIGILASLLLPVLSKAKTRAQTIQCLNNMKQLQVAWYLYADDQNDRLAGNWGTEAGGKVPGAPSWVSGLLTFETLALAAPWFSDSTNTMLLVPGGYGSIGAYTKSPAIYKCPADKSWIRIGGQTHPRVRSVSMNWFMNGGDFEDGYWYYVFRKTADIVTPSPSQTFVFVDEHEDSITIGNFGGGAGTIWPNTRWLSLPASRHGGAGIFSFADGHAEIKKWLDPRTPCAGETLGRLVRRPFAAEQRCAMGDGKSFEQKARRSAGSSVIGSPFVF